MRDITLKENLALHEKLWLLRDEKGLKLSELAEKTGISTSTLQRMESDRFLRVAYQDIFELAIFYDVSAD